MILEGTVAATVCFQLQVGHFFVDDGSEAYEHSGNESTDNEETIDEEERSQVSVINFILSLQIVLGNIFFSSSIPNRSSQMFK